MLAALPIACVPSEVAPGTPPLLEEEVESVDGAEEPAQPGPDDIFTDTGVLVLDIELDDDAIAELATSPTSYVEGAFTFRGERWEQVGVRLKGNSTYQWIDGRPAWKLKFDEFVPGGRFFGLERLTLDSNYWDASMMAETLAYRTWRRADSPAPRTGYAWVRFNAEDYGLYTIVEAMDDSFVEQWWPGSEGGLWEMGRSCDVDGDCSCYELQDVGDAFVPDGLDRACAAAATGDREQIAAHWDRFPRYHALERVVNHPDSYSFNLNNYYLYHDPLTDRVTLTPWGADSTFSYAYPPDAPEPCQPGLFDDLTASPAGYLATWCLADEACTSELHAEMLSIADQLERDDLAGDVLTTAARIDSFVAADPRWPWGYDTWAEQVDCFHTWITARPDEIRAWVEVDR